MDLNKAIEITQKLQSGIETVIKGRKDTIQLVLTALFADGHVLLEDYPGSGKTTLTKALGQLISSPADDEIASFRRVQFTPDLLPGDVLGVNIFEPKSGTFNFVKGPIFSHIVLADEINRTGPKVQAAFLECMAEKQVTIDNTTHPLNDLFFVVGTQNPLDMAGTYPLPLVQLDRFLLKIPMTYVDYDAELDILTNYSNIEKSLTSLEAACTRDEILEAQKIVRDIHIAPEIQEAIVKIVQSTRDNPILQFGASTRSALMLQKALKSWALIMGRDHCTEDDLQYIAPHVLLHRLRFHGGAGEPKDALMNIIAPHMEELVRKSI